MWNDFDRGNKGVVCDETEFRNYRTTDVQYFW